MLEETICFEELPSNLLGRVASTCETKPDQHELRPDVADNALEDRVVDRELRGVDRLTVVLSELVQVGRIMPHLDDET